MPNLTELFYINFVNILDAYKWYITWSVKNFNLWYIYNRFDNISDIMYKWIEKSVTKYLTIKAWVQLFTVFILWWYSGFLQVDSINTLVWMMWSNM